MGQVILWNVSIVIFLWILVNLNNVKEVMSMPREDFTIEDKNIGMMVKGRLSCLCGKLKKIREKDLDIGTAQKLLEEISKDKEFLHKINNYEEVKEFADCLQCNLTYVNCDEVLCVKQAIMFPSKKNMKQTETTVNTLNTTEEVPVSFVPDVIDIPIGGHKNHSRSRRFIGCSYPSAMKTAAISCRVYPSSIKCVQKCAYGFTLENGIRKDMQCKFKENRWIPSGFKECIPFVDCTVSLLSGGSAMCSTATVDKPPVCKIECLPYEDKAQVPMALYACKADGTWEPKLPFCAVPGSGLMLAPAPKIKSHMKEIKEVNQKKE